MNFNASISRKNFLKGSLALTAGLLWGGPQTLAAAATEYPHSPEEATGETAMHYLFDRTPIEPVQVFDNLFYIGSISVAQFVVLTPGHTPGCLSMIVPVTDHGEKHNVAIWGSTAAPTSPIPLLSVRKSIVSTKMSSGKWPRKLLENTLIN